MGKSKQQKMSAEASSQLYVRNLPWEVDSSGLQEIFEGYGTITECTIPVQKGSDRSRGFGYVTFARAEDAAKALEAMAGATVGDGESAREIGVALARPKPAAKPAAAGKKERPAAAGKKERPAPAGKKERPAPAAKNASSDKAPDREKEKVVTTQSMPIPAEKVGWVMGKKGDHINQMQKQSECTLRLQDNEWRDYGRIWKYITLTGTGRQIDMARKLIYLSLEKFNADAGGAK